MHNLKRAAITAIIAACFAFSLAASLTPAAAAIPAYLAVEIERIAANYGADSAAQFQQLPADSIDSDIASMAQRAARRGAESQLAAAVIGAISEQPMLTGEIVEAAIRAMPGLEAGVVSKTVTAFPGFQQIVLAAAARARVQPPHEIAVAVTSATDATDSTPDDYASSHEEKAAGEGPEEISDPLEGVNRAVFFLNDGLDTVLIRPIAYVYGNVVPPFVKRRVSNFFSNIKEPVVFANDLLQLELEDASVIAARFLVNSTLGLAGLFDVASEIGLPPHKADFGQTLHAYGAGPGPYLVLPLLGPSNLRDGIGLAVDALLNPFTWLLEPEGNLIITAGTGLVRREELLVPLDALRESSVDYYAALRSLYYQDRAVTLGRGALPDNSALDALFEAFE